MPSSSMMPLRYLSIHVFEYHGYQVDSLGWDDDTDRAERVLKG